MIRRLDPLIILAVIGGLVFAVVSWVSPPPDSDRHIRVDRAALLTFIQFRMRAFDATAAAQILDALPPDEKNILVDDYIREEMLYREARKMGFGDNDYVIRRRMVQKVEFMNQSLVQVPAPSQDDLLRYWQAHAGDFIRPAHISFVHLFRHDQPDWEALKLGLLPQNVSEGSHLFPYHLSYADRPITVIAGDFGAAFTSYIFDPQTPLGQWVGPIASDHGQHLVWISHRSAEIQPEFEDRQAEVAAAWAVDEKQRQIGHILERLKDYYDIDRRGL